MARSLGQPPACLIHGGACPEYEAAITAHPDAGTLADFVAANATRAILSREARAQAFMKHDRWGKPWKVLFAAIVAENITAGGTNPARIPPPIAAALARARDFATGAAVKP